MIKVKWVGLRLMGFAVLGTVNGCATPQSAGHSDFRCKARNGSYEEQFYDLSGRSALSGSVSLSEPKPGPEWAPGAAIDLMRDKADKDWVRIYFKVVGSSGDIRIILTNPGEVRSLEIARARTGQSIPFTIALGERAGLVEVADKPVNQAITTFRPQIARAVCFAASAGFAGLDAPRIPSP